MRTLSLLSCFALVVAFSGCDSVGIDDGGACTYDCPGNGKPDGGDDGGSDNGSDDGGSGGNDGSGGDSGSNAVVVDIAPTQTYLYTFEDANAQAPAILLEDLGIGAGEGVCFQVEGDYLYGPGASARDFGGPLATGVFSATSELLAPDQRHRVTGALDAGDDVFTGNTYRGDRPTDIDQDFDVTDTCLNVPDGAKYVFFSPYDNYFQDNTGVDGEPFRVVVTK